MVSWSEVVGLNRPVKAWVLGWGFPRAWPWAEMVRAVGALVLLAFRSFEVGAGEEDCGATGDDGCDGSDGAQDFVCVGEVAGDCAGGAGDGEEVYFVHSLS
jgi:hypothetical protein